MAIPLSDIPAQGSLNRDQLEVILNAETEALTSDLQHLEKLRDYYGGAQDLNYATDEFSAAFGDQFSTFRDNWCEVVVDAVQDRAVIVLRGGVDHGRELGVGRRRARAEVDDDRAGREPVLLDAFLTGFGVAMADAARRHGGG